jgi:protein-tyrosine phosphatase
LIIEDYRDKDTGQGIVLIGHSMGGSLAALLASRSAPNKATLDHVSGLIAICPRGSPPTEKQVATFRKLLWIPNIVFETWRRWDRRGGIDSPSVRRFVGSDADEETKKLQERYNTQSISGVWRRMASGGLPKYQNGSPVGGLPGRDIWAGLEVPVFLIGGESDSVTKPEEIKKIASFLSKTYPAQSEHLKQNDPAVRYPETRGEATPAQTEPPQDYSAEKAGTLTVDTDIIEDAHEDPSTPNEGLSEVPPQPTKPRAILKTTILPAPASHALLYQPSQVRIVAGLISDFLCGQVSPRLSLAWQLQFLSTAGKWDVKNLTKWQQVAPVSEPIAGIFRAMKTLREVDEVHCPEVFVRDWGSQVKDIVDISHENPAYDLRGLEKGGINYHKLPTVSKIPPTGEEVNAFVGLIDRLREEQKTRATKEGWEEPYYIGVHCHYGFNRTGYLLVCYLVEREGFGIQNAVDLFARQRPEGIKHAHFLDQLFVRYCVGLKQAPTL